MLKRTKLAGLATSAVLMTSMAFGQVNLTSHTAGAGTAVAITATALVEYAADRGIANIQLKDGQTGTKYVKGLAEGKIDIITAPFILPFVLGKAVGPYSKMDKAEAAELAKNIQLLYPWPLPFQIFFCFLVVELLKKSKQNKDYFRKQIILEVFL